MSYIFVFLITSITSFFNDKKNVKVISILIILILSLFAGTRMAEIDNDYREYSRLFALSIDKGLQKDNEVIFYILPKFLSNFFYYDYVPITFLCFAVLGVSTKIIAIQKLSICYALSIIIYFSSFYFGQEFTTIRAGVAAGIFLLMITDILENNRKAFFLKLGIAFLFHYSSLIFIPIWFLVRSKLKIKYYYFALVITFFIVIIKFDILTILHLDVLIPKMKVYTDVKDEAVLNPFNFKMLISFFYFLFFAVNFNKAKEDSLFVLLFKLHILSLVVFYLLAQASITFSLRSFDLLSIVQVLLLPYFVRFFSKKIKLIGYLIVVFTSVLNLYYILFISNNIREYSSWLF